MTRQKQEVLNKRVVQFYLNYQNENEKIKIEKICDHIIEEGLQIHYLANIKAIK